ncbi:hypothetical protein KCV87_24980 [Actinosynnema pretiosum subsp. pretiosum]|uniref:Uncharacterized protein n=1 Tax=Actinosynnema pretiosum subsp. pretiosum TaxID=103721 RepID=A0AA45R2L3_9PSEU|nr:hypothetical protein [Actinosynnema mirum]AXX33511.1 hypothetical protein APASM_6146 [Actinosynnema pretiosum subsp. pretiosum]QUF02688.1 hypothetical protein KCV87_24980 [Actinosynnema pretiosum subsp. pretiosum]
MRRRLGLFGGTVLLSGLLLGVLLPTARAGRWAADGEALYVVAIAALIVGTVLALTAPRR